MFRVCEYLLAYLRVTPVIHIGGAYSWIHFREFFSRLCRPKLRAILAFTISFIMISSHYWLPTPLFTTDPLALEFPFSQSFETPLHPSSINFFLPHIFLLLLLPILSSDSLP